MTPQQRSLATLLVFGGAALVVGRYAYFGVIRGDEAEGERKAVADRLFAPYGPEAKQADGGRGPLPEFTKVTVFANRETTVLEKQQDGAWRMLAPVRTGVDQFALDALLNQLRDGKVDEQIEAKPSDEELTRFGIKPPQWIVEATAQVADLNDASAPKAQKVMKIAGGVENAFNASVYLQKDGDPAVYSAAGATRLNLAKSSYDLRDKQVLSVDEPKVQSIDVVRPKDGSYSLARAADGKSWNLAKPKPMEADTQGITIMLNQFKAERAIAFPSDSPEARKANGLETPAVDATFTVVGGDKVRFRLAKVGQAQSEKVFALREDSAGAVLAELPSSALSHLDKPGLDLRDKSVLKFNRDAVAEVLFKPQGGGTAIAVKRNMPAADAGTAKVEAWAVTSPEQGPAKVWKVSSNLWSLSALLATEFLEENPRSWEKYGINDKSRQVVLLGADGKPLATLTIGSDVKGKESRVYVRGTRNTVLEMDTARMADFPTKVDDVLDRPGAADAGTL